MHKPLLANRLGRWLAVAVVGLLAAPAAQAQLTGTKAIPTDYATVAAAIADLNTAGVGAGGVTFIIPAGYAETFASPTAGAITATGTAANPIVFQKTGTGANPKITAGVGTTTNLDAIISLSGSDYVTLDGLELAENAANITPTTQMEFGIALFRPTPTDGCQNNTIRNCVVTLNKANTATFGIYGAASTAALATSVAATSPAGANSNNKINGNTVSNAVSGMYLTANASTAIANYDLNNEIGVTAGNTVTNFGGAATSGWGIGVNMQNGAKISNNTVNSNGGIAGTSTLRGIYGNTGTSSNFEITNNTVTLASGATTSSAIGIDNGIGSTAASNTVTITGNTIQNSTYATSTTGAFYGIQNTASAATVLLSNNTITGNAVTSTSGSFMALRNSASAPTLTVSGNTVGGNTLTGSGEYDIVFNSGTPTVALNVTGNLTRPATAFTLATTGSVFFLNSNVSNTGTMAIQNNTFGNFSKTGAGGTVYGYYNNGGPSATQTISGNTLSTITLTGATSFNGFFVNTSTTQLQTVTNNTISGIVGGSGDTYGMAINYGANNSTISGNTLSSISGTGTVYGLATGSNFSGGNVFQNTVSNISSSGASSSVYGMYLSGITNTVNWYQNKVYNISSSGATPVVSGMYVNSGATQTLYNNLIGNITAPAGTGYSVVNGLYISGGTTVNVYNNTVYLNASSTGATFGSSGIYYSSTPTTVTLRNNIVVNTSTAAGAGYNTVALRRSTGSAGVAPTTLGAATNNNLYYAGTPSATNLIYAEGTSTLVNAQQTLGAYKAFVAARESSSITENPPFLSTTGSDATFLHISPTIATQVESSGAPIAGVTTDFDGDARNATTPDLGADEGTFTPQDLSGPTIVYAALGNTTSTANRTITATITDASGVGTGANAPRLYYRKSTSATYTAVNATSVSGNDYTFTFDFATIGGVSPFDIIQYYVAAQDNAPAQNTNSTPLGASGNNPPGTAFTGTPQQFYIQGALSGTYYVGTGTSPVPARTYATLTAAVGAYNNNNLGGAVTFLLLDASYSATTGEAFPLVIAPNPDASATNTLTIKPNTGVTSTLTGSNTTAILALNGADYVTLDGSNGGTISATDTRPSRNLTVTNTNASATSFVVLVTVPSTTNNATNNTVKNLIVVGSGSQATQVGIAFLSATGGTGGNNNNVVQNNAVQAVQYGIYSYGVSATVKNTGTVITQNDLNATGTNSLGRVGIIVGFEDGIQITRNSVDGINFSGTGDVAGISAGFGLAISASTFTGSEVTNATITRNNIGVVRQTGTYSAAGIALASAASGTGLIANNFVSGVGSNGTSGDFGAGIYVGGGTGSTTRVVFNSVSMTNPTPALTGGNYPSFALAIGGSSPTVEIRNNVLVNTQTTGTANSVALGFAYAGTAGAYAGLTSSNNDFFVSTGSTFGVGQTGGLSTSGVLRTTLAALNAETGQDSPATSKVGNPQFVSASDLHTMSVELSNAGTPVASVTVDYDGETRSATTPDIGADEFTLPQTADLTPVALAGPAASNTCYSATEPVVVTIRQVGGATLDFAATPATVTVVVTPPTGPTQTFTATVNTGTLASGATRNVTLTGTLDMSAPGAYSFAVTATMTGDVNTANDVLTPVPTRTVVAPAAGTLTTSTPSICVSGTAALTLAGSSNGGIQLQQSTDNTTFTDITGATGATYTTPVLTQTTYFRARTSCNANVATSNVVTVTVTNPQVATAVTPVAICAGSTATLTATAATGTSLRFFDAVTGGTALTGATTAGTTTTLVTPALTASRQYFVEAYTGGTERVGKVVTTNLGTAGYSLDAGIVFNVTAATQIQNVTVFPSSTTAGTLNVALMNSAGTSIATAGPFTIPAGSLSTAVPVVLPLNFNVPVGTGYRLMAVGSHPDLHRESTGNAFPYTSPSGNVSITGGYLSSATATYYFFYNWQISGECVSGTARTPIQVDVTQPSTASLPAATATSCGTTPYQLAGTVGGSSTTGTFTTSGTGTFSPSATDLNATYTPSAADITAGSVTITLTATATGPCSAATATLVLSTSPAPIATFSYPAATTYCAGSANTVTPTLGTGAVAGTFSSTTGLSIDPISGVITLSTSTAGTYTVTNTVAASGACAAVTATTTVTITPATSAAFNYASGTFCQTGTNPTPTVTGTAGGTFSSTTGLSIDASTGAINLSASTVGTYTVTYTVAGACGSSATASVTVTASQVATFSYPAATTYCAGSASTVTPTLGAGASAGTFSSTTGLSINPTTGVITLSTSTAGTYTVTNTIAAAGSCSAATATATVTITPATSAAFAYSGPTFCLTGTNPTPTVTGTAGGTFSSTTGLTINATTGAITLSSSTPGTYTVTYTVAGACGSTATASVTVTSGQVATFSYPTTGNCVGNASAVTPTLGTGATAGTFTSTTGLTINATTGAINLATSTAGTYTVTNTVAAAGGCGAATATATITVNPRPATPTLSAAYNGANTTLTSSATTGNQFYLNGVAITGATGQTYVVNGTPAQLGSYTVVTTSAAGCASLPSAPIVVSAAKNSIAGTSLRVYPNPTPTGEVTLELTGYRIATQLTVLDALGRVVTSELLPAAAGTAIHTLNLSGVATGVYLLRLSNADGVETRRIVRN